MRTSYYQFHILVDYMEKNGDISKFKPNPIGKANMLSHWENLTTLVNLAADGIGPVRTPDQWRKVWSDFKNNVRKKMSRMRRFKSENGYEKRSLSKLELRVMAVINCSNVKQPKAQECNEMVDVDDSLETGGIKKLKHPLRNSDSDNDDAYEDDKAKVKIDYSIQNFTEDYGCNSALVNDDPNNLSQQNEQKDNITSSLAEIESEINSNTVRRLLEDEEQKKYTETSNEEHIIRHCNNDWLPQNEHDYNNANSWINSIQYKRQKNSSASGWVESNQTQKNKESLIKIGQNNFVMTKPLIYMDRKDADNPAQDDEERNNSIGTSIVNIRENSSSQSITQLSYSSKRWSATDMENGRDENSTQIVGDKVKGTGVLIENNGAGYFTQKENINYDLNILSSNTELKNRGKNAKAKTEMARIKSTKNIMQKNTDAYSGVARDSKKNNDACSSTQINELSTEMITDGININAVQNHTVNATNHQKSEQITPPVVKRRRKTRSSFIDEEMEQRRREQELELMRLEIQREELKLKTKRLTLIERIVTIAEQFV